MYVQLGGMKAYQDVVESVGVLRDDPLLYLVVVLPIFGILGIAWMLRIKFSENKELREENARLVEAVMEQSKVSTQAITAQVEVMRNMRADQKEAMSRYETLVTSMKEEIKQTIRETRAN
jgi:hypothetical protein